MLVDLPDAESPKAQARFNHQPSLDDSLPLGSVTGSSLWWLLLVGVAAAILCAPFFRMLFLLGDEGIFLRAAEMFLQGKRFYADFFNLSPGSVLLIAAWFAMAGISFGSARTLAVLIIVGIACFTFLACRQASRNPPLSAVLAIGWVMMSVWIWMQISHHWFATLFSMAASWASFVSIEQAERRLRWPLVAGAAAGAAVVCTPHSGVLALLAATTAFLNVRRSWAPLIAYALTCLLVPACVLAVLLWQNAIAAGFEDVAISLTGYTSATAAPFGFQTQPVNRPLMYLFGFAALLGIIVCAHDWRGCLFDRRFWLSTAFAIAAFLGCYPRPDIWHISYTAPLALPLLAFAMTRLTRSWRPPHRYAAVAVLIALLTPSAHHFESLTRRVLHAEIAPTPRGDVALFGSFTAGRGIPELMASIAATPGGDGYFFYPYDEMLSFLTGRNHVSKYDLFTPWYTTPLQYRDACRSVIQHASWVVVDRNWTDYSTWKEIFPALPDRKPPETVRFEEALDSAFELVANAGTFELRRRRKGVNDSVCGNKDE
jgi:hypothetical protein